MTWNWEQPDWPRFSWDAAALAPLEERFLFGGGELLGASRHLTAPDQREFVADSMTNEAVASSEIEGELLNRASVQSSIRRHLGLPSSPAGRATPSEEGMAELMTSLHSTFQDPLSERQLFEWHSMLLRGRFRPEDLGRYRTGSEPMQVVSGSFEAPRVHFEAPPSARVSAEMAAFVDWFNGTSPTAVTRSGLAHLWFVSIHPFEDGNGRIGRAISEKALAQSLGSPIRAAISPTILASRRSYYQALEDASRMNEVTGWLVWFAESVLAAQSRTMRWVDFLVGKTRLLDRLRDEINPRQEAALLRMFREGPDGFVGGLSAANYQRITGAPSATATRDLADLVEKGALTKVGELKHTRYFLRLSSGPS